MPLWHLLGRMERTPRNQCKHRHR